jgi:hypothetical protein
MVRIHVCDACVAPCDDPESQMVVPHFKDLPGTFADVNLPPSSSASSQQLVKHVHS